MRNDLGTLVSLSAATGAATTRIVQMLQANVFISIPSSPG